MPKKETQDTLGLYRHEPRMSLTDPRGIIVCRSCYRICKMFGWFTRESLTEHLQGHGIDLDTDINVFDKQYYFYKPLRS